MLSTRGKTTSRGLTTWCLPHMKAITVILYHIRRQYLKLVKTSFILENGFDYINITCSLIFWMFCFVEVNKIIWAKINRIITKLDCKKKHTTGSQGLLTGQQPLSPSTFIVFVRVVHQIVSPVCKFLQTHRLFYHFYSVKVIIIAVFGTIVFQKEGVIRLDKNSSV